MSSDRFDVLAETWDCMPSKNLIFLFNACLAPNPLDRRMAASQFVHSFVMKNKISQNLTKNRKDVKRCREKRGDALYSVFGHCKMSSWNPLLIGAEPLSAKNLSQNTPRFFHRTSSITLSISTVAEKRLKVSYNNPKVTMLYMHGPAEGDCIMHVMYVIAHPFFFLVWDEGNLDVRFSM